MKQRWKSVVRVLVIGLVALAGLGWWVYETQTTHHSPPAALQPVPPTGDKVLDAIHRGVEFLRVHQEPNDEFSTGLLDPKPALTALVVESILGAPKGGSYGTEAYIRDACAAILRHQQDDGGIYTPTFGLGNYCTSISIMALSSANQEQFAPQIDKAVAYLRKCQLGDKSGAQAGGFGYGSSGGNADLSNTLQSLEALKRAGLAPGDDAYKRAAAFITRCQNSSETNTEAWAGDDGGFIYRPGTSKAGEVKNPDGNVGYKSYGLMSYAGLMSLLHAEVSRDDPRVQSALRWVKRNYTFDENVNLGPHGLFYYYLVMSKALAAYGERVITEESGKQHDWASELSTRLLELQQPDGSWRNTQSDRWMESDSVLVTAYMVQALSNCWRAMNEASGEAALEGGEPK